MPVLRKLTHHPAHTHTRTHPRTHMRAHTQTHLELAKWNSGCYANQDAIVVFLSREALSQIRAFMVLQHLTWKATQDYSTRGTRGDKYIKSLLQAMK